MRLRMGAWRVLAIASLSVLARDHHVHAGAPIPPKSGASMCVLTPADFQSAGVTNAAKPTANVQDGGGSVYCVYSGKSAATGGIELDVFYPAGSTVAEAQATYKTAVDEGPPLKPISIPGADEAHWSASATSGGPPFASLAVRRSTLVFTLGIPAGSNSQAQIVKLAGIVLQRL
ncbi:MAG TPA: hypothetical protein VKE96_17655 [Vicinamibacterales bacterium]|nr:hypothetical protein [Vicinamibacterales bacterium]